MNTNGIALPLLIAAASLAGFNVSAQESDFDLSSQRSEKQDVLKVPGEKLTHDDWLINPTPHAISLNKSETVNISAGVKLDGKSGKFAHYLGFIKNNPKGVKLDIVYGEKEAKKSGVKPVSGAYTLNIGKKGITIVGYDERGAFYGIQTLRQLVESPVAKNGTLPYAEINDYPDLADRGVVEGFYGEPWSHDVRLSLIDFYGKNKMNSYLYGPKDDPYHSCPNWRLPYPEKEAENIRQLIDASNRNYVDFIWAIHPGQDIKWNEEDYNNLKNKFSLMYDLGVRHFAIFFDDISGEGTNPQKQTQLLNRLTEDFVKPKGDVGSLTICPTDYSQLWADPTPTGSLAIYGEQLPEDTKVFWTGEVVCSDLTPETLEFVNSRIRRPAFYWWNYPVTDYARNYVLQGPVYGLDTSLTSADVSGVVSNPMEHGEASKLALYGVADYTWNVGEYNPIDNWERGLSEMMPEAADAYRTFAIHSCDTETGYRRDESWETATCTLADWNDATADALEVEFEKIEKVPAQIEQGCTNQALLNELQPWLTEFGQLGTRGKKAIELARLYRSDYDPAVFWQKYVQNLMSDTQRSNFEKHKSGTMKLQPFYDNVMDDMAHGFLKSLISEEPKDYKGISSFANSGTTLTKLMLDGDTATHYTSAMSQKDGDWIGVDLRGLRDVAEVSVRQGRNSVDDVDYFDNAVLEVSPNGKDWITLVNNLDHCYDIDWSGEPVKARYVRLRRLDSKRRNYASVRTFDVNPLRIENLGFAFEAPQAAKPTNMFDSNPQTSGKISGVTSIGVPDGVTGYTLLMGEIAAPLTCKLLDSKGGMISETKLSQPFSKISLQDVDADKVVLEGDAEVFEIIAEY